MIDIEKLIRKNIASLTPYSTARDEYQGKLGIFLDANESPFDNGYNRYPDPHQKELKTKLSEIKGLPIENIFLGNGSDEAIDLMFRIFCEPGVENAVSLTPSYGMYKVAAAINDIEMREVNLGENFTFPKKELMSAVDESTKLMFICSPNNPSGNIFPKNDILYVADNFNGILVIDEAYVDFAPDSSLIKEIYTRPNIVILQTLSKAWGMAGLRLGMAFATSRIIELMSMVKYPYNVNESTIRLALRFLENPIDEKIREIINQRDILTERLSEFDFVQNVYPSNSNFLLVKFDDPNEIYAHLLKDGIIVRNRNNVTGCKGCLRITVGLEKENKKLIDSLCRYEK